MLYNNGIKNIVKAVPKDNPPIIAMAKGFWLCAPIPFDKAAGNNPKIATNEAVKTGRNFCTAPRITASVKLWLVLFCLIIDDNRITPFWIETPIAAIKPTPAEIEK